MKSGFFPFLRSFRPGLVLVWAALNITAAADDPVPVITDSSYSGGEFTLELENLDPDLTYYVERSVAESGLDWEQFESFKVSSTSMTWRDETAGDHPTAFYRIAGERDHAKVGQEAVLINRFHGISGTARIVDNRTIEISNFNYDGQGIVVQVYLSPDSTFESYIVVSDDLVGPPFVDATLILSIPPGTDLSTINNISIWCVNAGISFGDGVFANP